LDAREAAGARLAEAKEDENFFGSDLTYRDLELPGTHSSRVG